MAQKRVDFVIKEKGASKAAGGFKKVDNSLSSAAKSAAMYAAAYIGVRGIINITKTAIEAFGVQEQAEKRLTVATGRNTDALLKQASALQQVTEFGDEMIIGVQASLAAFADSDEEIKRLTVATLDLAAATGMDLKAAGDLIAKSYGSSTNALSRYGIEVTGVANSTERLDTLTGNIAERFEGQASAAAETMAGKISQMKNAVGDAAEALGGAMSPAVISIANSIKSLSELLTPANEALDRLAMLSLNGATLTKEQARANKEWLATMREIKAELGIQAAMRGEMRIIQTDENFLIAESIELFEEQAEVVNDLKFNFDDLTTASDLYIDSMVGAIVHGQSMKDSLISASKALTVQLISDFIKRKIAASTTLAATTAETIAAAHAIGLAWATPAALAATATAGVSAVSGGTALAATVAGANAIAAFAEGGDFVTSGPQIIMVGEEGRERVQVTPLEGPNINGPQGNTFIFNGDIIGSDEYMENNLIPAINLATSQGRANLA